MLFVRGARAKDEAERGRRRCRGILREVAEARAREARIDREDERDLAQGLFAEEPLVVEDGAKLAIVVAGREEGAPLLGHAGDGALLLLAHAAEVFGRAVVRVDALATIEEL